MIPPRPPRAPGALVTAAALVAALGLAATACNRSDAKGADARGAAEPVVTVALHQAAERPAPDRLTLTGTVMADETSNVTAAVPGKVLTVLVDRGSRVKFGDPLLRLDASSASLSAQSIRAQLAAAEAQEKLATDECKRAQQLLDKGAITRSQYEREMTSCTAAAQNVAATKAQLQLASKSVADGVVRAPFAGVVTQRMIAPGEWAGPGMPLLTLVDDEPLRVDLSVPEAWVPRLQVGQEVAVEAVAYPGQRFSARVTKVGSEIGRMSRALVAEAELAPGSPLVPGMFAEATITVGATARPAVPRTAVVRRGNTWRLFAVVKGRLEERVVQRGPELDGDQVAIVRGLAAGERVAAAIDERIVDGLRVE